MKKGRWTVIISHFLLVLLIVVILLPGKKKVESAEEFLAVIVIMELFALFQMKRARQQVVVSDSMTIVWTGLLIWEFVVTKKNWMHPVLVPAPENVFAVFGDQYLILLEGVAASLQLLLTGVIIGVAFGSVAGLVCGWIPRLRDIFYPIANVLAPIPSVVFAPYVIAIMPTFRSASAMIVVLGIFWPSFLNMILRVNTIEPNILDAARAMNLSSRTMIFEILLPYALPGVVTGLKVTMTTAVMMLTFAEMMGATCGMGYYIMNYNTYGNYTNVVAGIIVVGMVVTVLNKGVTLIQRKVIYWQNS